MNETKNENETLEISKSQRKREADALFDLAKRMISMADNQLNKLPLDEDLRDEVDFARSIRAHGAKKRQLMTVAKMLRKRDNAELLDLVYNADQKNRQENARFHHIETWRDHLIAGTDKDLFALLEQTPTANAQTFRQLIRNAKKEIQLEKSPVAARKLFKLLRALDSEQPLPPL